jgi:alkylation response protein AidB-like acyl-CoA dehydrogenase
MRQLLSEDELKAFCEAAHGFAKKTVLPMFEGDFSDGDLNKVPNILEKAFEIGLSTAPDENTSGFTHGVFGTALDEIGAELSLRLLSIIAEVCGGIAMNLHSQGVASNILTYAKVSSLVPKKAALAVQEEFGLPGHGTLLSPEKDAPARILTTAVPKNNGYELNGVKSFVYGMDGVEAFVTFARIEDKGKNEWGCFLIPVPAKGLEIIPSGVRTGLRACTLNHIKFTNCFVQNEARIDKGNALNLLKRALCLNWMGATAIASGIAKGAVDAAKKYASERYQGGTMIENHPAIQMLIADSESRASAACAIVSRIGQMDLDDKATLPQCAMAKLTGLELCAKAVTDSLQTFGGYGYMEDYGMEKRLRDVTVLKSAFGSPLYLKRFIFEARKGGM